MKKLWFICLLLMLATPVQADPDKNESGHWRGRGERHKEHKKYEKEYHKEHDKYRRPHREEPGDSVKIKIPLPPPPPLPGF
ncbi:MAG: hypothetical protein ABFS09_11890 [Thermodesulfobacteriota bacterium]